MSELPAKLQGIVEDFSFCEGQEKLEYLLEFAEALPPLPEQFADKRDEMEEVHDGGGWHRSVPRRHGGHELDPEWRH